MPSILRMIEVLKRSYLKQNECILKENSEFKDKINSLLQINSNLVAELQGLKVEGEEQRNQINRQNEKRKQF